MSEPEGMPLKAVERARMRDIGMVATTPDAYRYARQCRSCKAEDIRMQPRRLNDAEPMRHAPPRESSQNDRSARVLEARQCKFSDGKCLQHFLRQPRSPTAQTRQMDREPIGRESRG